MLVLMTCACIDCMPRHAWHMCAHVAVHMHAYVVLLIARCRALLTHAIHLARHQMGANVMEEMRHGRYSVSS